MRNNENQILTKYCGSLHGVLPFSVKMLCYVLNKRFFVLKTSRERAPGVHVHMCRFSFLLFLESQ